MRDNSFVLHWRDLCASGMLLPSQEQNVVIQCFEENDDLKKTRHSQIGDC